MGYISPEDRERIISEIRRYKIEQYYSDKQIMEAMKISKPTFIKYKRMMYEDNSRFLAEQSREEIAEHINTTVSRLERIAQQLQSIADTAELDSDKIKALEALRDITVGMGKIDTQERDEVLRKYGNTTNGQESNTTTRTEQAQ